MTARRLFRKLKQLGPAIVLGLLVIVAGISLWQAWEVSRHLRREAREASRLYGEIIATFNDPRRGVEAEALLAMGREIRASGLPIVITDSAGNVSALANVPEEIEAAESTTTELRAFIRALDRVNAPISVPGVGEVHFGALPVARRLTLLTVLQFGLLITTVAVGIWAYRTAVHRHRDRLWVAMARESAHQLGTPLMSAGAWVDRLAAGSSTSDEIARHLRSDLERLQRVVQRFERIGRPARRDRVGLGVLAERVAAYFQPRLPRHAHAVELCVRAPGTGPTVSADPVLLEWALEALVRNAVDALSRRGGTIEISVRENGGKASVRVQDDGPGVPPEVRSNLFEPGVSTKPGGWGIGLALARRIVEDVHGGRLDLVASEAGGTTFVVELPFEIEESEPTDDG